MHIDKLIEMLERVRDEIPNANVYFTVEQNGLSFEANFENFYIDTDSDDVEMLLIYKH